MTNPPQKPAGTNRGMAHDGFTPLQKGYQPVNTGNVKIPAAPSGGSNVSPTSTSSSSSNSTAKPK